MSEYYPDYILKIYRRDPAAIMPKKNHSSGVFDDAASDLFTHYRVILAPGERCLVDTGLSMIIPDNYWVKFHERSGLAAKHGVRVGAGVIDSGYTGPIKVVLHNTGHETVTIESGQAIAQFTIEKVRPVAFVEIDTENYIYECEKRQRGERGFGSSDSK